MNIDFDMLLRMDSRGVLAFPGESLEKWLERAGELPVCDGCNEYGSAVDIVNRLFGVYIYWADVNECFGKASLCLAYFDDDSKKITINKRLVSLFGYNFDEVLAHEMCHLARSGFRHDIYDEFLAYMVHESAVIRFFGMVFSSNIYGLLWVISWLFVSVTVLFSGMFWEPFVVNCSVWTCVFGFNYLFRYRKFHKCLSVLSKRFGSKLAMWVLFRLTQDEAVFIADNGFKSLTQDFRWKFIHYVCCLVSTQR